MVLGLNRASTPVAPATKTRSDGTTYVDPKIEHGFYMRGNTGVAPWYDGSWGGTSSLSKVGQDFLLELVHSCDSKGDCTFEHRIDGAIVKTTSVLSSGASYRAVALINTFDDTADIGFSWACPPSPPPAAPPPPLPPPDRPSWPPVPPPGSMLELAGSTPSVLFGPAGHASTITMANHGGTLRCDGDLVVEDISIRQLHSMMLELQKENQMLKEAMGMLPPSPPQSPPLAATQWTLLHSSWIEEASEAVPKNIKEKDRFTSSNDRNVTYQQIFLECDATNSHIRRVYTLPSKVHTAAFPKGYAYSVKTYSGDTSPSVTGELRPGSLAEQHYFASRFIIRGYSSGVPWKGQVHCNLDYGAVGGDNNNPKLGNWGRVWVRDGTEEPTESELPKDCTPRWTNAIQGKSPGSSLFSGKADTIEACREICESYRECKAIIYRAGGKYCSALSRSYVPNYQEADAGDDVVVSDLAC